MYWPLEVASRDYLVALRLPVIYLHCQEEPQASLFATFLREAPAPIPITGSFAGWETGTVSLISTCGDWEAAISWPGAAMNCGNLTVFAGVRPEVVPQGSAIRPSAILATLGDGPAVTMFTTDGDATFYSWSRGFQSHFGWQNVQGQRLTWTINPALSELAPVIWNYYATSRSKVSLAAALSGVEYVYPQLMSPVQLADYVAHAAAYTRETGLRVVHQFEGSGLWTEPLATAYYRGLRGDGYLGVIYGYSYREDRGLGFWYAGAPTPAVWTAYSLDPREIDRIAAELAASRPGEVLLDPRPGFGIGSPDVSVVADPQALGGQAVLIPREYLHSTSYSMAIAFRVASLAPGEHDIVMRAKVADNSSSGIIARMQIMRDTGDGSWPRIGVREIAASEFARMGVYQEFTLPISLPQLTTDLVLFMDYGDGSTDLTFDFYRVTRRDGLALPTFAAIVIPNISIDAESLETAPGAFAAKVEAAGGVVLSADEFLAALNPEFMIDFATPILGTAHPALAQARTQLLAGQYFESLITVRDALRAW